MFETMIPSEMFIWKRVDHQWIFHLFQTAHSIRENCNDSVYVWTFLRLFVAIDYLLDNRCLQLSFLNEFNVNRLWTSFKYVLPICCWFVRLTERFEWIRCRLSKSINHEFWNSFQCSLFFFSFLTVVGWEIILNLTGISMTFILFASRWWTVFWLMTVTCIPSFPCRSLRSFLS